MIQAIFNSLTWKLLVDAISALIGRIGWKIIVERLITRLVVAGLRKLASMTTNTLMKETVEEIVNQLLKDGLKKARE
ncbi:MAG: hypothetical protein LRY66_06035 [Saccharospirillaceae bacterium]|nr:hypothetical protein [Saccharospirillaceae bacterium]MCD8530915.1 hypothetical protein [Saccharospirillaceae bacterium]